MVIARIKGKPEQLCVVDELQHLSDVVQNGLRALSHGKDMQAKMEHPSSGCQDAPTDFGLQSVREFSSNENMSITATVNFGINAS